MKILKKLFGSLENRGTNFEIRKSPIDKEILLELLKNSDGISSGNLAKNLERNSSSIINRLPGLEQQRLVFRSKQGKSSLFSLTPRGKGLAQSL